LLWTLRLSMCDINDYAGMFKQAQGGDRLGLPRISPRVT
jgi:hypothetical protein